MLNNLDIIKPLLTFSNEDDFYYLQILQRSKDENPENIKIKGSKNNSRVIKNYYINSISHLEDMMPEIIELCKLFNARASIRLNKRSYRKVGLRSLQKIAGIISNGEYKHIKYSYSKSCGLGHNAGENKTWILDLDDINIISGKKQIEEIINYIDSLHPIQENNISKLKALIPSKTGVHIISSPFNIKDFREKYQNIDIHKDNPTNLYIDK